MAQINTRIQNKNDFESNWIQNNILVLKGELIVYNAEADANGNLLDTNLTLSEDGTVTVGGETRAPYKYPRFKFGDGTRHVCQLPFAGGTISEDIPSSPGDSEYNEKTFTLTGLTAISDYTLELRNDSYATVSTIKINNDSGSGILLSNPVIEYVFNKTATDTAILTIKSGKNSTYSSGYTLFIFDRHIVTNTIRTTSGNFTDAVNSHISLISKSCVLDTTLTQFKLILTEANIATIRREININLTSTNSYKQEGAFFNVDSKTELLYYTCERDVNNHVKVTLYSCSEYYTRSSVQYCLYVYKNTAYQYTVRFTVNKGNLTDPTVTSGFVYPNSGVTSNSVTVEMYKAVNYNRIIELLDYSGSLISSSNFSTGDQVKSSIVLSSLPYICINTSDATGTTGTSKYVNLSCTVGCLTSSAGSYTIRIKRSSSDIETRLLLTVTGGNTAQLSIQNSYPIQREYDYSNAVRSNSIQPNTYVKLELHTASYPNKNCVATQDSFYLFSCGASSTTLSSTPFIQLHWNASYEFLIFYEASAEPNAYASNYWMRIEQTNNNSNVCAIGLNFVYDTSKGWTCTISKLLDGVGEDEPGIGQCYHFEYTVDVPYASEMQVGISDTATANLPINVIDLGCTGEVTVNGATFKAYRYYDSSSSKYWCKVKIITWQPYGGTYTFFVISDQQYSFTFYLDCRNFASLE